jgi:ATP-binding cassette subfamily B protein/subfamily B ATP-binding cassette protein MsbA
VLIFRPESLDIDQSLRDKIDPYSRKIGTRFVPGQDKTTDPLENEYISIPMSYINTLSRDEITALRHQSFSAIWTIGIIFVSIVLIKFVIGFFQVVITTTASQKAMHDLRSDLFGHLERMPVSFFDKNPVGRLVTRVTNDIRAIDEMLTSGVITIIQDMFIVVAIMILMLILDWKLALVSFIVLPFVVWLIAIFKTKTRDSYRAMRKYLAQVNATLAEHIAGVKIIQLFNQYSHKEKDFNDSNFLYYKASMRQLKLFAVFRPLIGVSRNIATAIILWYAGGQILDNVLTLGLFMAFIAYMERLYEPINSFTEKFNILQSAMSGAERIFDLRDQMQAEYRNDLPRVDNINGEIEFKNVWMHYQTGEVDDADYILKNISFTVREGEKIALVGHTGSGKTSIVNLILNMYPFQKGDILVNGRSINDYRLPDLRANIGMVQQDVFLFSGTIRENIILNNESITDTEVNKITDYINVSQFINSLPGKLDEPVQERGATFSVGQRQLISFARVLAYDPAIFILDEATSNIDTETEILIQDALFKIMQNRTSIIIAHRLSTIQHVDRILVLHKGEIVESGSHQELLNKEGLYYDLYRLQYS